MLDSTGCTSIFLLRDPGPSISSCIFEFSKPILLGWFWLLLVIFIFIEFSVTSKEFVSFLLDWLLEAISLAD